MDVDLTFRTSMYVPQFFVTLYLEQTFASSFCMATSKSSCKHNQRESWKRQLTSWLKAKNYTFLVMTEELNVFMKHWTCVGGGAFNSMVKNENVIAQANVKGSMGMAGFLIDLWNLKSRILHF